MRIASRRVLWLQSLLLAGLAAGADAAPPLVLVESPPPSPLPTGLEEQVEVRLVQIRIFALDKDGRPVTDLRPEEVRVRDAGKAYVAAFLDPVRDRDGSGDHVRMQLLAPGGPEQPADAHDGEPRSWVLFLDRENEPREARDAVIAGLESFVENSFGPADRVAVLSYAREIRMETSFTTDREALKQGIREAYAHRTRSYYFDRERQIRMSLRGSGGGGMGGVHADNWRNAVEGVLRFTAGVEGRKAVLVVTPGWGLCIDPIELLPLIELAMQLDVTLHFISPPVDPYGAGPVSVTSTAALHAALGASQRAANREYWWMAGPTGGRVFEAETPAIGLTGAVALERSGYTLGYYVDDPPPPNRSRRIRLKSTRPGVELIGPRGYYQEVHPSKPIRGDLQVVSSRPVDTGDVRAVRLDFQVALEPEDLGYRREKGEVQANFGLEITVHAEGGLPLARVYHFIQHALDRRTWTAGDLPPLTIDGWLELSEGTYELRAVVTNPRDESEGRFSRRLRVGPLPRT
jgi:VWFA-related protein